MPLLLYGNTSWTSPYVLSCFVALREKGLSFEVRDVALERGAQWESAYAQRSLTARVPLFVDGDLAISESSAIVEYLEEAYPPPGHARVFPPGLRERARARQIMAWLRSDLMSIRTERSSEYVFYPHAGLDPVAPLSEAGNRSVEKLLAAADRLIPASGAPLFGTWCIADTDLAMMLQRLAKTDFDVPRRIRAYADAQWQRPSVQTFCAHVRPPFQRALTL
jgi:glutathione S-transferase